jgi:hypothetical protein
MRPLRILTGLSVPKALSDATYTHDTTCDRLPRHCDTLSSATPLIMRVKTLLTADST